MLGNKITVNSDESFETFLANAREYYNTHKYLTITVDSGKKRTLPQNNALHLYCEQVANELNGAGYDFRTFIKQGIEVPFNRDLVKGYIWLPIMKAMFSKESTKDLERAEYPQVYEVVNRALSEKGIHVPFPNSEQVKK